MDLSRKESFLQIRIYKKPNSTRPARTDPSDRSMPILAVNTSACGSLRRTAGDARERIRIVMCNSEEVDRVHEQCGCAQAVYGGCDSLRVEAVHVGGVCAARACVRQGIQMGCKVESQMALQQWRCSVRSRQGGGIGLVGLFQVSSKGRRLKSGTRKFEHGRLQGGVHIRQGGVC